MAKSKFIKIFVEGIADKKFLGDYISHIIPDVELHKDIIVNAGGWTNINSQKENGESIRNQMKQNTDNEGINLVIFDADNDFTTRKDEIEKWKTDKKLEFELFLFPNAKDCGALEDLLENIIVDKNRPVFDCWNVYEHCLQRKTIEGREKPLTVPAKKTKIYGYLEALLGETRKEKKFIKEKERDYKNTDQWNLDAGYLQPLKEFLESHLK